MPRQKLDFTVIKSKGTPYYKGKIRGWTNNQRPQMDRLALLDILEDRQVDNHPGTA